MIDVYRTIIKVLETHRKKHNPERIDYIVSWEEPDRVKGLDFEASKKKICELIAARGLKDKAIANQLGITPQAVNKWRHKGTFFVIENLYVLSGLLGVSVDKLLVPKAVKKCSFNIEAG